MNLSAVTQSALDDLCQWWLEVQEDEMDSPDWHDVAVLFVKASTDELTVVLAQHPDAMYRAAAAAAAAALGARGDIPAFFPLLVACGDEDDMVRVFANGSCQQLDEWYRCYFVWDFLFMAIEAYQECKLSLRQLALF